MRISLLLGLFFSIVFTPVGIIYILDPYQYFHKSYFTPNEFLRRMGRMQIPGVIKNYIGRGNEYDTIVLGGSLAENFESKLIKNSEKTKSKAINLAFSGATPAEQTFVAEHALATRKIKTALWTIGPAWRIDADEVNSVRTIPYYMYNNNYFDDLNYFYGLKNIQISIGYLLELTYFKRYFRYYRKMDIPPVRLIPWYQFGSWAPFTEPRMQIVNDRFLSPINRKRVERRLASTEERLLNGKLQVADFNSLPANAFNTEKVLLNKIIKKNPDVNFKFIFPPISTLYYHSSDKDNTDTAVNRAYALVDIVENYKNAKAFFMSESFIINDMRYYKDHAHYDRSISRYILRQIAKGNHELTRNNVDSYVSGLKKSIDNFDRKKPFIFPKHDKLIEFDGTLTW